MSTSEHARYADDCGAYLLGALGEHERQAFEAHLAVCAECRQEVDNLRPAADALPRSVTPLSPPPGLKRSLMEVVEREVSRRAAAGAGPPPPARAPGGAPALVRGRAPRARLDERGVPARGRHRRRDRDRPAGVGG